jgi:hypothetical protein
MANRKNTFILKRSNVSGKKPTLGQLELGEIALNTADAKLHAEYTGGATGATEVREIGWNRVNITGDTMTGPLYGPTISATTIDGIDANIGTLSFNTGYTGTTIVEGSMHWDEDEGTISLGMHGSQVSQQIGLEQYYYIKNQSGATIENGRVVKVAGTIGASGRILGEYMIADGTEEPSFTLGVATEDIVNGEDGYVTSFGLVRGIDTTGSDYSETWNDGDVLWVSPTVSGGLTNVEPLSPNLHIEMAIVIHADANGSIFVRPHLYPYSYDLQDMGWSAGTESHLDVIQWDGAAGYFNLTNTPNFNSLSATTIDTDTILSGGTNIDTLFATKGFTTFTADTQDAITATTLNDTIQFSGINIDVITDQTNKIITFSGSTGGGGGGEANTASNIGGGEAIFSVKSGVDLQFKTLTSTGGTTTITSTGSTVNIESVKPELTKSLYLPDPIATDDIGIWEPGIPITITNVVYKGVGATSTTFNINHSSGTDLWASDKVATTTRQTSSSFTDATCTANNYIRYQASAVSGTPTAIEVTITYTED